MKLSAIALLGCFSITMAAQANEILLTSNQPLKITYRIAHKNQNGQPVFGEILSAYLNKNVTIPVSLNKFDKAGIIIAAVNEHELPLSANQFDSPKQCSMTTDKTKATGAIALNLLPHTINCHTYGGIFG